ncbi:5-phosphohydroxy-L-lysine phospho-lyase-like [Tubulanus polymorphus]|uniref:5-phosphohydroxy-L-lysine phospho-lyase-like n=1 Tax=Tubulanus polymorphus TaxID=672921 RepID=UPI003DA23BE9
MENSMATATSSPWSLEKLSKEETIHLRKKHLSHNLALFFDSDPVKIVRASGQYMYDEDGNQYLDCINNVCHVGHCHPDVVKAGAEQMATLSTNSRYLHDNIVILAEKIAQTLPGKLDTCFFANSGSEANDLALRLANAYTGKSGIIALDQGYHGHVASLMDVNPYYKHHYGSDLGEKTYIAPSPNTYSGKYRDCDYSKNEILLNYLADVDAKIRECQQSGHGVSAFLAETLQSCGGQVVAPSGFFKDAYKRIREAGGLCIADEVQVGFGRVGKKMWAFELYDVIPDIVTMGKPMGNGHPISAVVTTREIADKFTIHYFNTFGGNPVSCAIGLAVLDVIHKENLLQHAVDIGEYLMMKLGQLKDKHDIIGDFRVVGMFAGIELVKDRDTREPATQEAKYILKRMKENLILISTDGPGMNVLKFKPPMCFNKANVNRLCTQLDYVFSDLEKNPLIPNVSISKSDGIKKFKCQTEK